jgi:hypothetical protein
MSDLLLNEYFFIRLKKKLLCFCICIFSLIHKLLENFIRFCLISLMISLYIDIDF